MESPPSDVFLWSLSLELLALVLLAVALLVLEGCW